MDLEQTKIGDVLVAAVHETRVDGRAGSELLAVLRSCIDGGDRRIVVDLSEVAFIDSTGLGALVATLKHLGRGGQFALCGVGDAVATLFKLTRMDKVFKLYPSREAAVSAVGAA
jgi:anti-sigma B factor antagonist